MTDIRLQELLQLQCFIKALEEELAELKIREETWSLASTNVKSQVFNLLNWDLNKQLDLAKQEFERA